jgi:hypothetical protein
MDKLRFFLGLNATPTALAGTSPNFKFKNGGGSAATRWSMMRESSMAGKNVTVTWTPEKAGCFTRKYRVLSEGDCHIVRMYSRACSNGRQLLPRFLFI